MGDALANLPVGGIGSGALVGLIVLLILNGRLVTRQTVVDLRTDRDKWVGIAETWQAVAQQNGVTLAQHTETLAQLIEYAKSADHAIQSIQSIVERGPDGAHPQ